MLSARGTTASLRGRQDILWEVMMDTYCPNTNPTGYINLGTAENTLMQADLLSYIKENFDPSRTTLSYGEGPSGSRRLRVALASFVNAFFSPVQPVQPSHISVSNGVTGSLERCAFELGDPGDAFLLGCPYYGSLPSEIGVRAKISTIPVIFGSIDPLGPLAVSAYEASLLQAHEMSQRVRAIILCSPHNPLGRCYPKETLISIMQLCQKYQIHLIVDEIYALSVYTNPRYPQATRFTSVLAIDSSAVIDPALVHVLWGMSKDFGANGLRIGCVVSQNNLPLITALDCHAPYSYPAAFLEYITCLILEDHKFVTAYVADNRRRLAENLVLVTTFLDKHGIPYLHGTNAGLFIWADIGSVIFPRLTKSSGRPNGVVGKGLGVAEVAVRRLSAQPGPDLTGRVHDLLLADKVYISNGNEFGSELPGWFRIVFAQSRDVLQKGLERMARALGIVIKVDENTDRDVKQGKERNWMKT